MLVRAKLPRNPRFLSTACAYGTLSAEDDEAHDYFITRLFVREGFYDYQNGADNGADSFSDAIKTMLDSYTAKKRSTARQILDALIANPQITIAQMTAGTGIAKRTIQRYLSEFQAAGVLKREGSDISGIWVLQ